MCVDEFEDLANGVTGMMVANGNHPSMAFFLPVVFMFLLVASSPGSICLLKPKPQEFCADWNT